MVSKQFILLIGLLLFIPYNVSSIPSADTQSTGDLLFVGGMGPGNYTRIQDAIDNATDGATILVYHDSSPYQENILITKSIQLQGENKETTAIDGRNQGNTITIECNNVLVTGFTISNGNGANGILDWYLAGLRITADNITITDNIITNNRIGIFIKNAKHITLTNNSLVNDCVVIAPYDREAFYTPFIEQEFIHTIENNTVNGKPLLYHHQLKDTTLPSNAGQIILISSHNNTIQNTHLNQADFAIILINCTNNTIMNNTLTNGSAGLLWLLYSNNNQLINNTISNNLEGICLDQASTHNMITYNILDNNSHCNLMIESKSHHNKVQHNDFIGNTRVHSYILNTFCTTYRYNYWNDHPSLIPKLIRGEITFSILPLLRFPWFGVDWQPSTAPNIS